jgi:flagellin-like hook-associated protein FlgL
MSSDIVLTAALRNNLLSLQNTQNLIDDTQLRLATGRKVNSALDNPQNFFAAQSLNNRADDLNRLLDGIGQSITAIEQTDTALQSLTSLVDQADSIAQQARDALAAGTNEAKVTGTRDLTKVDDLTSLNGITAGDQLVIQLTDPSSATAGALVDFDEGTAGIQPNLTITIGANDSIEEIVTRINDNANIQTPVVEARIDDKGQLEIKAVNGGDLNINFLADAADTPAADSANVALAQALGFGEQAALVSDAAAAGSNVVEITALGTSSISSISLFDSSSGTQTIAQRSSLLSNLENSAGTALDNGIDNAADDLRIGINNGTLVSIETNARTIQNVVDDINSNASLNTQIQASFDEETGQINIRAIDPSVESIQLGFQGDTAGDTLNLGFGTRNPTSTTAATDNIENLVLGESAGELAGLETEYNNIRAQIDQLVADSGYRSTNLLNGDDLTTFFNEDRSNSLTTEGTIFTSAGLGISEANFGSTTTTDAALAEIRTATLSVREFNASIANDLAVLQTRQDFTTQTINNLNAGADKLTIADQNEEGANLLALQTRQQLGVTSLSLASQSQQAVLRLF